MPNIERDPIHLGLGATAAVQPPFTGEPAWYQDYGRRTEADGAEGRLVSMHSFSASWDMWEVHPVGAEVVLCVSGEGTVIQRKGGPDGDEVRTVLRAGDYAINEPGDWHTMDADQPVTVLFITAGQGTENHPRSLPE
jgi:quercetin dioxygenase-like cupin family protein